MRKVFNVRCHHRTMASLSGTHRFVIGSTLYDGVTPVYYATSGAFGCSKNYASPKAAILGMCADHAVTVITMEEIEE